MKKIAVVICFIAVGFGVQAQVDTLRGKVPYFHYNYYDSLWCQSQEFMGAMRVVMPTNENVNLLGAKRYDFTKNAAENLMCIYFYGDTASEVAIRMNMDNSAIIKGIAVGYGFVFERWFQWGNLYANTYGTYQFASNPGYNTADYIFNIYDNDMNMLRSDTVATSDLRIDHYMEAGFHPTPNIFDSAYYQWYSFGRVGYEAPAHIGLCYIMFDTTLLVPETFYVGITTSTPLNVFDGTSLFITALVEGLRPEGYYDTCNMPYESRRYRVSNNVGEQIQNWEVEECHYGVQTCLYPILSLPCHDVDGLQYEPLGSAGTIAYVSWNGDPSHSSYELSYGPRGTAPGEGTVVQPSATHWVISPLDRNTHYDVYVRARCDLDTIKWSAWSDPLHVHIASYGIDEAAVLEVTLSPNPTTGKLTIGCEAEIKEVEMYDMQGRMISGKWKEESGKCAVLDLAGLPAGSYILVAHTTKGVATRTVEKR